MTDEQPEDAEVIAALGAFQPYRTAVWPLASKLDMRRALDAAAAHRRAQPASGLADDARKIAEALQPLAGLNVARLMTDGIKYNFRIDAADIRHARAALPLAESLAGKIEDLERERGRLRDVIERDRTKTAEVISTARGVLASRAWLAEGRGSYEFDDEKYQEEFGAAITEILVALDPLRALAADWSDCPKDFQGARVDWKARAEAAESQIAVVTKERDEARELFIHARSRWDHYFAETERLESQLAERDAEVGGPIADIAAERARQISAEGWTPEHDDEHNEGELALAAAAYALGGRRQIRPRDGAVFFSLGEMPGMWPWKPEWWKPKGARCNLVRAGALIIAEIERLDRRDAANAARQAAYAERLGLRAKPRDAGVATLREAIAALLPKQPATEDAREKEEGS